MDSQASLFHDAAGESFANLPPRRVVPMQPSQIVAWTPARLMFAFAAWVMEETYFPAPAARTDA